MIPHKAFVFILVLVSWVAAPKAQGQSNVTTTGGTTDTVPMFNGSSTVIDSVITNSNGNISMGSFTVPVNAGFTGAVSSTGNNASFGFVRRNLSTWPSNPAEGDYWVWYNPDGTARLWTVSSGDVLTVTPTYMTFGPFGITPQQPGQTGAFVTTGNSAGVGFARRTLTSWPSNPASGDLYAWYNPDGNAHLWTISAGDLITINTAGSMQLDKAGSGIIFPDGSIQTKAQVQGPAGPKGATGATGPTGPQGPAGPPAHTSAVCSGSQPSCSDGFVVFPIPSPCSVTSDTR